MPWHPTYRHCPARVRMAYWFVINGYYPEADGGVSCMARFLYHCRIYWHLNQEELSEVAVDWLESHPEDNDSEDEN